MRDTVELLEQIGRDASLRRASPEVLSSALEDANASEGLRVLVAHHDSTVLAQELGLVERFGEHMTQTGAHEDDTLLN
ncbi:MAG TPA: hypothetical protein VGN46_06515 [Luteibacter sp.]|jgi:hypothetical protein|uniref:hypothetical protein n=1 Tax=Luteibacter sp. TaxID=1886636 RepID=UPI002F3FCD95